MLFAPTSRGVLHTPAVCAEKGKFKKTPIFRAFCKTPLLSLNYVLVYFGVQCLEGTTKA